MYRECLVAGDEAVRSVHSTSGVRASGYKFDVDENISTTAEFFERTCRYQSEETSSIKHVEQAVSAMTWIAW